FLRALFHPGLLGGWSCQATSSKEEIRMLKLHANARTCLHSRRLVVDRVEVQGWTLAAAAEAAGVSVRTVSKWRRRYRAEGEQGLADRCSAPASVPSRTDEARVAVIASLRRLR